MCQASLENKSAVFEIGDIVVSWGDQIVTKISEKMNALTDFDAIRQIIDATIEEDCYIEDCPSGKIALVLYITIKVYIFSVLHS